VLSVTRGHVRHNTSGIAHQGRAGIVLGCGGDKLVGGSIEGRGLVYLLWQQLPCVVHRMWLCVTVARQLLLFVPICLIVIWALLHTPRFASCTPCMAYMYMYAYMYAIRDA